MTDRPVRRIMASLALIIGLTLALVGCDAFGDSPEEWAESEAIATEIKYTLIQRPDVVTAKVIYQNNISAPEQVAITITVQPDCDLDPVADEAVRLAWLSKLDPLSSITVWVTDAGNRRRETNRRYVSDDLAALEATYGPRPPA